VTTESVQFLESGVILKVTPSVDQRGRVMLKVHPEVSSATLNLGIPSKKSTEVTTELICEDGQSIFIGGLIKSGSTQQRDAVPLLGNIPVLGYLFSNTTQTVSASETVVIITPHVIKEPQDADSLSEGALRNVAETDSAIVKQEQDMKLRTPRLPGSE
jgi:type II secretory pathway component GspD/PulD (secretin)